MKLPIVRDVMARALVTLKPDIDIYKAMEILLKHKVSGAPVIDENYRLLGVLSELDCLRFFTAGAYTQFPGGTVGDFMTKDVRTVGPDAGLFTVAGIFLKHSFRRLPVVENDRLIGQVSRRDVMEGSRKMMQDSGPDAVWTDSKYFSDEIKAKLQTMKL